MNIHEKIINCIDNIIAKTSFKEIESSIKNTTKGLEYLYNSTGLDDTYIRVVDDFASYIKKYKPESYDDSSLYFLYKLKVVLKNPPKKFPIGCRVVHKRQCFENNSLKLKPHKTIYIDATIDDYDYTVNQYQVKYDDGSLVGWIEESNLQVSQDIAL